MTYKLLDSGFGEKLEQFGDIILIRPSATAIWHPSLSEKEWGRAHGCFSREGKKGWEIYRSLPSFWTISIQSLLFKLKTTDFGHLGIFPEHAALWPWIQERIQKTTRPRILNLFAYSGGATLAAAYRGAEVTHLDAAKGMVTWARENALLNGLETAPIRWIVDDVKKYVERALRRGERYEGIILDPPTFGKGNAQEIFKIERDLPLLLQSCRKLLSDTPLFILLTCHTPGFTPIVLEQLLREMGLSNGSFEAAEMRLQGPFDIPCGSFARWSTC